jgi:hypothetical protein
MEQITALINELSFEEKIRLNKALATSMASSIPAGGKIAKIKGERTKKDPSAPKRKVALGTAAWMAFVKNTKMTSPERFEGVSLEKERLVICKAIRAEDPAAYDAFVENYKEEHKDDETTTEDAAAEDDESSDAGAAAPAAAPEKKRAPPSAEHLAAMKAGREKALAAKKEAVAAAKAAAAPAPAPAPAAKPVAATKTVAAAKPAAAAKTAAPAKAPAAPKKEVKKVVVAAPVEEETTIIKKEINEKMYWLDTSCNSLWLVEDDGEGWGAFVGKYTPGSEDGEILFQDEE